MACRTERFLTKLLSLVACMVLAVALVPAVAHADETEEPSLLEPQETVYTVIIDPGEGEGEPLVFRSDECEIAASASEAQYNQFYRESDGSLGFHIDAESCPETFTAPYGHVFYQFSPNAPHLPLSSETTTFTVLWVADAVETYGPIEVRGSDYGEDEEPSFFARVSDAAFFYMGGVKWQVIGEGENSSGPAWLAISTDVFEFSSSYPPSGAAVKASRYCFSLKDELFSETERGAIGITNKHDGDGDSGSGSYQIVPDPHTFGDFIEVPVADEVGGSVTFPLSVAETAYYLPMTVSEDGWDWSFENRLPGGWWCRTPSTDTGVYDMPYVGNDGSINVSEEPIFSGGVTITGVRPAFQLDLNQVLFLSAAEGGKSSATELGEMAAWRASSTEVVERESGTVEVPVYKLTLYDWGQHSGFSFSTDMTTVAAGGTLSITYSGSKTGDNEYVSAMLCDSEGNPLYYGHVAHDSASGTASLTIPADVPAGDYVLKIYAEQANGDFLTDYASSFSTVALTVTDIPSSDPPVSTDPEPEPQSEPEPTPQPEPTPEPTPAYVVPKSGDATNSAAIALIGLLGSALIVWGMLSAGKDKLSNL